MISVTETRDVFRFDELSDSAKDTARQWFDEGRDSSELADCAWGYDFSNLESNPNFEYGFPAEMKRAGITVNQCTYRTIGGQTRSEPAIYWSLGYCQSDGVWFDATVDVETYLRFRNLAGKYRSLYNRAGYYSGSIDGDDYRGISVSINGYSDSDIADSQASALEDDLDDYARDLAHRMYWQLRECHEFMLSDESLAETCFANEYGFLGDGKFYGHAPELYAEVAS